MFLNSRAAKRTHGPVEASVDQDQTARSMQYVSLFTNHSLEHSFLFLQEIVNLK